jgi:hypothetical protein
MPFADSFRALQDLKDSFSHSDSSVELGNKDGHSFLSARKYVHCFQSCVATRVFCLRLLQVGLSMFNDPAGMYVCECVREANLCLKLRCDEFYASVYWMQLRFQSNYFGLSQPT